MIQFVALISQKRVINQQNYGHKSVSNGISTKKGKTIEKRKKVPSIAIN